MRESRLTVATVEVELDYTNTPTGEGYTDAANHTFEFTRRSFLSLSDAAKHMLCDHASPPTGDELGLAQGEFLLLMRLPRYNTGEGTAEVSGFCKCACHCAPYLIVNPYAYEEDTLAIGTRSYGGDPVDETIYAAGVTFGIIPAFCRRGIALHNQSDTTSGTPVATMSTVQTGGSGTNHVITVTWDFWATIEATASIEWEDDDSVQWDFNFNFTRHAGEYFELPSLPTISADDPEAEADKARRFRVTLLPQGVRIEFMGAYAGILITDLNFTDGGGTGINYDSPGTSQSTADIATWSHFTTGRAIDVADCPADWSANDTYDVMTGEDVTGSATIDIAHT